MGTGVGSTPRLHVTHRSNGERHRVCRFIHGYLFHVFNMFVDVASPKNEMPRCPLPCRLQSRRCSTVPTDIIASRVKDSTESKPASRQASYVITAFYRLGIHWETKSKHDVQEVQKNINSQRLQCETFMEKKNTTHLPDESDRHQRGRGTCDLF